MDTALMVYPPSGSTLRSLGFPSLYFLLGQGKSLDHTTLREIHLRAADFLS
jgi:hypothetical protein